MKLPELYTERLVLRKFSENDTDAVFKIFSDAETNKFLPWFPLKSTEDAEQFFKNRLENQYSYAICLKEDNIPIGYVNVDSNDSHDLGYGLLSEYWYNGIVTEACKAVIRQLISEGVLYITSTHDINNPRSGAVMRKLGMKYQYSYEEQWQPKNFPVTFRMYQLNLDGNDSRVYRYYWEKATVHFVESGL